MGRPVVWLVFVLTGCEPVTEGPAPSPNAEKRAAEGWTAKAEVDCPNWLRAPAGSRWRSRFYCDPCNRVWGGGTIGGDIDPTIYWLSDFGLRCECITDDYGYSSACHDGETP